MESESKSQLSNYKNSDLSKSYKYANGIAGISGKLPDLQRQS